MTKPNILVTGATGKTGTLIVSLLRRENFPVRAVVRAHDERSERLRQLGAEVVLADLYDYEQMLDAMRGTRRAYYCPPMHPFMIQSAAAFAAAAREVGLEAVVGLSQWLASPDHPSLHTRQVWQTERLLGSIPGVAHVNLNPGWFADNDLRLIDFATLLGVFPVVTGDGRNAPPSSEDIARCAAALLADPEPHAGKSYRPTGPELLSAQDIVAKIRRVLGHPVIALPMPFWMLNRAARIQGVSEFVVASLRHYVEDHKQGAFERGAPTEVVRELTGSPAEDIETTIRRYASLPFARKTAGNRLRAFVNFNRVPLTPGYNLGRYGLRESHPFAPNPRYGMESDFWKATHNVGTAVGSASVSVPREAVR